MDDQHKLSKEAEEYLNSMKAVELNIFICKKFGISNDKTPAFLQLIDDLFFQKLKFSGLVEEIKKLFSFPPEKTKDLAMDIAGIRLLVVKKWLSEDVEAYIRSLGGKAEDYYHYVDEQKKAIEEERKYFAEQWEEEKDFVPVIKDRKAEEKTIDKAREREDSVKFFGQGVASSLTNSGEYLTDYNLLLLELILDEEGGADFKKNLEKSLLANGERITAAKFFLDGKQALPTIANWLTYFIKEKGTANFDNIVLTDFLVKSANAKILNEEEKSAVKKLLILYRNLKFFPDSMPNQTGEGWEIIPSESEVSGPEKARTVSVPSTADFAAKAKVAAAATISTENIEKIKSLKEQLSRYPERSLERKAVEEEIKKLEKK